MYAFHNYEVGAYPCFRTKIKVFDLIHFKVKSKTFQSLIQELLYADNTVFIVHTEKDMKTIISHSLIPCTVFVLTISIKKTKVLYTHPPG